MVKGDRQLEVVDGTRPTRRVASTTTSLAVKAPSAPASCSRGTVLYEGSATSTTSARLTNGQPYALRLCAVAAGNRSKGSTAGLAGNRRTAPVGSMVRTETVPGRESGGSVSVSASDDASGVEMSVCPPAPGSARPGPRCRTTWQ